MREPHDLTWNLERNWILDIHVFWWQSTASVKIHWRSLCIYILCVCVCIYNQSLHTGKICSNTHTHIYTCVCVCVYTQSLHIGKICSNTYMCVCVCVSSDNSKNFQTENNKYMFQLYCYLSLKQYKAVSGSQVDTASNFVSTAYSTNSYVTLDLFC